MFKRIVFAVTPMGLALAAAAQPAGPDQTVTVTASPLSITLPAQVYALAGREFEALRGQYALSDGRTLTVSGRPRRMTAQIDGLPAAELVAASPSVLVARNRQISLDFQQADNGVVREVLVTYVRPMQAKGRRVDPVTR